MNDHLDRTVRTVLADIVATTPSPEEHPIQFVSLDHTVRNRRPLLAIAAAVVAVVGIGVTLFAVSGQRSTNPSTAPVNPTLDKLLYPQGMKVTQAYPTAAPGNRAGAVLVAPDGRPFAVSVMENFWGSLPSGTELREINGHTFGASAEMGSIGYTTLSSCLMVDVGERIPQATAWSGDALAVLTGLTIDGTDVTVHVPAGWTSMGTGVLAATYSISFTTADGRPADMLQMLDSPVGALLAQLGMAAVTPTRVAGQQAWLYSSNGWMFLAWNRAAGSATLGLQDGTAEQLVALAEAMTTGHGVDWTKALLAGPAGSIGTTSSGGSPVAATVATSIAVPGQCATRTLTVVP